MSRPLLLAYRALGLGDLLTGVPALRALRDGFPDHRLVLAAPPALAPLAGLCGAVDAVVDTAPLATPPADEHAMRGHVRGWSVSRPDVAVNLHGRGPQSHRALLATRPRRMIAFAAPEVPWTGPRWRAGEHEVRHWCRLLAESGIPADPARLDLPHPRAPVPAAVAPGVTVVHPGAASPARRWPAERWAAVARAERAAGRSVVLTGSASERSLAESVARAAGLDGDAVLAGNTDLLTLAAVIARAGRVLCGDTGVAHLATAFGIPSVVLFGPTPPGEWGPPPERSRHVVLHRGGRGDPHGDRPDAGLLAIEVADVLSVTGARFPALPHG